MSRNAALHRLARRPVLGFPGEAEIQMLLLRACPRCGGDMVLERERGYAYFECLQCTHVLSLAQERSMHVSARQMAAQMVAPHEHPSRNERAKVAAAS